MKTLQNLLQFKSQVREFNTVIDKIISHWNNSNEEVIGVLLQNLGFDGSKCQNFDLENEYNKCISIVNILQSISKYSNYHLVNWIAQEVDMLYTGIIIMSEDI